MPSGTDFFNELKKVNLHLQTLNGDVDELKDVVEFNTGQLITQSGFANSALTHQIKQLDTIICLLQQIAVNTCQLVNESHTQTGLQTGISSDTSTLSALYALSHAESALVYQREEALRAQIDVCCPPKPPEPACKPDKCPDPGSFGKPPVIERRPTKRKPRE